MVFVPLLALLATVLLPMALLRIERLAMHYLPRALVHLAWIPATKRVLDLPSDTAVALARQDETVTYRERPGRDIDLQQVRAMRAWSTPTARGAFANDLSRGWIVERAPGDSSWLLARFTITLTGNRVEIRTRLYSNGLVLRAPLHFVWWVSWVDRASLRTLPWVLVLSIALEGLAGLVNSALQKHRVAAVLDRIVADLQAGGTFRTTIANRVRVLAANVSE